MSAQFAQYGADGSLRILEVAGRGEWALSHLLAAGATGCTRISHPGPRWADYVFKLRRRGLDIASVAEHYKGPFAGTHGGYILRSKDERLGAMEMAA
jgi:hypothetical protein